MSNDTNNNKNTPRKPDLELSHVRGSGWDERENGGDINLTFRISMKSITARLEEAKESVRDDDRRNGRSEANRSSREDRQARDNGPRYER